MEEWSEKELDWYIATADTVFLYLYTPFCGTCQVAGKMLEVTSEMLPNLNWGKCNLNSIPQQAIKWEIESVPCLVILKNRRVQEKIYAFHSVSYLYEKIKMFLD